MDNISFNGTLRFLQNQIGLPCACCGRTVLSEKELEALAKKIVPKKGRELANFLTPYTDYFDNPIKREPLDKLIACASDERFANEGLKGLALRFNIFYENTPLNILRRLFDSILYSADHIVPRSEGGLNRQANYLPMHRACNSDRFSDSYEILAQKKPNFVENIHKALREIYRRIVVDKSGKPKYKINLDESYIENAADPLRQQGINVNMDFIKRI
ncbi:MAG: HNH endonuclease [bacterium]|nr:HNH endonuclease [bacterium]